MSHSALGEAELHNTLSIRIWIILKDYSSLWFHFPIFQGEIFTELIGWWRTLAYRIHHINYRTDYFTKSDTMGILIANSNLYLTADCY